MKRDIFETVVGFIVLICAAIFLYFSLKISGTQTVRGYKIKAKFENIEGIMPGSDVKIGGIKIGSVVKQNVDKYTYEALLVMEIDSNVKIPTDSSVKISSSGIMGSKYIKLEPGADEEYLKDGEELMFTQSAIDLEDLIGKFVFDSKEKKDK